MIKKIKSALVWLEKAVAVGGILATAGKALIAVLDKSEK